jgi:hypothetical protein
MATNTRKANGQDSTYKIKGTNSYRTVYRTQGRVVTATAKDRQTSRALAKAKLNQLPMSMNNNLVRSGLASGFTECQCFCIFVLPRGVVT